MSASILPTPAAGGTDPSKGIGVAMVEDRSGRHFKLTYRGETISLEHSGSLNRWAATGIVHRHNISLAHDGVTIDGRTIRFGDANAIAELEHIFNEPQTVPPPVTKPSKPLTAAAPLAPAQSDLVKVANSVKVTRDGFEFHISYLTKFGEHKTERLEKALEALQNMHLFKPHVSLQKAGIRIVVTSWDGESFIEEAGLENIEHATPEELEAVIKRNMQGISAEAGAARPMAGQPVRRQVTHLELIRKPHDLRFHVVFHRSDGTAEEGPLLIRANLPRLQVEGLFQPGINILITAMNDHLIIERMEEVEGKPAKQAQTFDLKTDEDARKIETALNACLIKPAPLNDPAPMERSFGGVVEKAAPQSIPGTLSGTPSGPGLRP
ncbi:MAG: hypothetical protein L0Z50_03390 [Verrucomicrobiales bacterium]|nr:hypothetical protein [Verrucomicrobiales bacterium]